MIKTILIDRDHHDSFFIDMTSVHKYGAKKQRDYVKKQLPGLYPDFTDRILWDYTICTINGKKWAVITVLEKDYYIELRIKYPRKHFITATSVLVCHPDFQKSIPLYTEYEKSYIDAKSNMPCSVPLSPTEKDLHKIISEAQLQAQKKKMPVFKSSHWTKDGTAKKSMLFPMLFLSLLLLGTGFIATALVQTNAQKALNAIVIQEPPTPYIAPPSALIQADDTAEIILAHSGTLYRYNYDQNSIPPIQFEISVQNPSLILSGIQKLPYIMNTQTNALQHDNSSSRFSASLYVSDKIIAPHILPDEQHLFNMVEQLKTIASLQNDTLILQNIQGNSGIQLQGAYKEVEARTVLLELIRMQAAQNFFMTALTLSKSDDDNFLNIKCTLVPSTKLAYTNNQPLDYLVSAFSLKKEEPKIIPIKKVVNPFEGYEKIGRVMNEDGIVFLYYRSPDGKIVSVEEE